MALVGNISGSNQASSLIGITGSVIVANTPEAYFPTLPGSDTTFFVSGSTDGASRAVFGGDVVISGSVVALGGGTGGTEFFYSTTTGSIYTSGSAAFVGGGEYGLIDSPADKGTDVFFYVSGSVGADSDKALFGGDVVISGSGVFLGDLIEMTGSIIVSGTVDLDGVFKSGYKTFNVNDYTHTEGSITFAADVYSVITSVNTGLGEISVEDASLFAIGDRVAYIFNASNNVNQVHITEVTNTDGLAPGTVTATAAVAINNSSFNALSNAVTGGDSVLINLSQRSNQKTFAHAEGSYTMAIGQNSHAEGRKTAAVGSHSHAEGAVSLATGLASHAEGQYTKATGDYSHAEGGFADAIGDYSHTEGNGSVASGYAAHAEGESTVASGDYSHAEGQNTAAAGMWSHVEGNSSSATGDYSHAEGNGTSASGRSSHTEGELTTALGNYSHAEGYATIATGSYSHAEGYTTIASGSYSHAEGWGSEALSETSHAEGSYSVAGTLGYTASVTAGLIVLDPGYGDVSGQFSVGGYVVLNDEVFANFYTHQVFEIAAVIFNSPSTEITLADITVNAAAAWVGVESIAKPTSADNAFGIAAHSEGGSVAQGPWSHAEGDFTSSPGYSSHSEGAGTKSIGKYSHAEGTSTEAIGQGAHSEGTDTIALGNYSHAEGNGTITSGSYSHAEGLYTIASGSSSHAEGSSTLASGDNSHAEGQATVAAGPRTHAEGYQTFADNYASHAEGNQTKATGYASHAEGDISEATGDRTHAEGVSFARGDYSHSEGAFTVASGSSSHAEGSSTLASGEASHAEGYETVASGSYSHTAGWATIASGSAQTVVGRHNLRDNDFSFFVVGNGTGDTNDVRSDAFRVNFDSTQSTGSFFQRNSGSSTVGFMGDDLAAVPAEKGTDVFFYVSGSSGSMGTSARGVAAFGGDVMITGSLKVGTTSIVIDTNSVQFGDASVRIEKAGGDLKFFDGSNTSGATLAALAAGGGGGGEYTTMYIPDPEYWESTGIEAPVSATSVFRIGNKLYAFGARTSGLENKIYSASWTENPIFNDTGFSLPGNVIAGRSAIIGDKIFIFGDHFGAGQYIYSASISDPLTWGDSGVTLPQRRDNAPLVVANNRILLFKGYSGTAGYSTILSASVDDPLSFVETPSIGGAAWEASGWASDDAIYFAGGFNASTTLYRASIANTGSLNFSFQSIWPATNGSAQVCHNGDELFLWGSTVQNPSKVFVVKSGMEAGTGGSSFWMERGDLHSGYADGYNHDSNWIGPDGRYYFIRNVTTTPRTIYRSGRKAVKVLTSVSASFPPYAALPGVTEYGVPASVSKHVRLGFAPWRTNRTGSF